MDRIRAHELALTNHALDRLDERLGRDCHIFGPPAGDDRGGVLSSPTATYTRTTWPRCSTSSVCACARATTVPNRSCASWVSRRRPAPHCPCYSDEHDIEVLIEGLLEAGRLFG